MAAARSSKCVYTVRSLPASALTWCFTRFLVLHRINNTGWGDLPGEVLGMIAGKLEDLQDRLSMAGANRTTLRAVLPHLAFVEDREQEDLLGPPPICAPHVCHAQLSRQPLYAFPSLQTLTLLRSEAAGLAPLPLLTSLSLHESDTLASLPTALSTLRHLSLIGCPGVDGLPDLQLATSLELCLMPSLPQLPSNLLSLRDLSIAYCRSLTALPATPQLTRLHLKATPAAIPEPPFARLHELCLWDIPGVSELPPLPQLTRLELCCMPGLAALPSSMPRVVELGLWDTLIARISGYPRLGYVDAATPPVSGDDAPETALSLSELPRLTHLRATSYTDCTLGDLPALQQLLIPAVRGLSTGALPALQHSLSQAEGARGLQRLHLRAGECGPPLDLSRMKGLVSLEAQHCGQIGMLRADVSGMAVLNVRICARMAAPGALCRSVVHEAAGAVDSQPGIAPAARNV